MADAKTKGTTEMAGAEQAAYDPLMTGLSDSEVRKVAEAALRRDAIAHLESFAQDHPKPAAALTAIKAAMPGIDLTSVIGPVMQLSTPDGSKDFEAEERGLDLWAWRSRDNLTARPTWGRIRLDSDEGLADVILQEMAPDAATAREWREAVRAGGWEARPFRAKSEDPERRAFELALGELPGEPRITPKTSAFADRLLGKAMTDRGFMAILAASPAAKALALHASETPAKRSLERIIERTWGDIAYAPATARRKPAKDQSRQIA